LSKRVMAIRLADGSGDCKRIAMPFTGLHSA
jgi:hypothetical protein